MALLLGGCAGGSGPPAPPNAAPRVLAAPGESPSADAPTLLRLVRVMPADGSIVQTHVSLRLEFDRELDPACLLRAVTLEYVDPGVTFLAAPFRHVGLTLEGDGRTLLVEPPEMLVGREVRVRLSPTLRGADGSRAADDMTATLSYRVMELPP